MLKDKNHFSKTGRRYKLYIFSIKLIAESVGLVIFIVAE